MPAGPDLTAVTLADGNVAPGAPGGLAAVLTGTRFGWINRAFDSPTQTAVAILSTGGLTEGRHTPGHAIRRLQTGE
jgi:hypothetical protein